MRPLRTMLIAAVALAVARPAFGYCTYAAIGSSKLSMQATCTATAGVVTEANAFAAWSSSTTYAAGAQVIDDGQPYTSLQASNTGHTPATSPTWWALAGVSLANATSLTVTVCAATYLSGATPTAYVSDGATLDFYYWDARTGKVSKTNISLTMGSGSGVGCSSVSGDSPGWGLPIIGRAGRLIPLPNTMAASDGGSLVIELLASNGLGQTL